MFVFHQLLYIHGAQQQLPAINRYQSRNSGLVVAHARSLHTSTLPATNFFTASCTHSSVLGQHPEYTPLFFRLGHFSTRWRLHRRVRPEWEQHGRRCCSKSSTRIAQEPSLLRVSAHRPSTAESSF